MQYLNFKERYSKLTNREKEVAELVAEDFDNYQISKRIGVEEASVRRYIHGIFAKVFEEDIEGPEKRARRALLRLFVKQFHGERAGGNKLNHHEKLYSISDEANIVFIQALATTLASWNDLALEDRHRESFISLFDALLEMIVQAVGKSDDICDEIGRMHKLLEVALRQALETA